MVYESEIIAMVNVELCIRYSQYGAVGDGVTNDIDAIIETHAVANEKGLKVCADPGAVYYISEIKDKMADIQTNTDWSGARFIIDDSNVSVHEREKHIFCVSSKLLPINVTIVHSLKKYQKKIELTLPYNCLVSVVDESTMHYIRHGLNQDNGSPQTDIFVLDKEGAVDVNTPIIWDFDNITSMTAFPIEAESLTITGGHFTTIANRAESKYTYYSRGIKITRSNVHVSGLRHDIIGELDHGAPYRGFMSVHQCANVTIQDCQFSAHKTYSTIGSANAPVNMGTYDLDVYSSVSVTFKDCSQLNDIHDTKLWGIFGSNLSKNLIFDTVSFSRFDAHMGVVGATIKNSTLGYMGINLIGSGLFLLENTHIHSGSMINLRQDYGSTWQGDIIIRDCIFTPQNGAKSDTVLISGQNLGHHDFGYICYMPSKITIEGLTIQDGNPVDDYTGPKIFGTFNQHYTGVEEHPYVITNEVIIKNIKTQSRKKYVISNNSAMFKNVTVREE